MKNDSYSYEGSVGQVFSNMESEIVSTIYPMFPSSNQALD